MSFPAYTLLKQRFMGEDHLTVILWTDADGVSHSFSLPLSGTVETDAYIAANADYQRFRANLDAGARVTLPPDVAVTDLPEPLTVLLGTGVWYG